MFGIAKLLPREDKFYRLLEQLATQARLSARHLRTFVASKSESDRAEAAKEVQASKQAAKKISTEITKELCFSFVTPFDREDIQDFASNLYKIPKTISKVREYLDLHRIMGTEELLTQIDLIVQEAEGMDCMMKALIHGGKTDEVVREAALLDALENRGDEILSNLLVTLIKNTEDPRQLILKKDLYDMLERIIDRYRNAGEIALQIALKHS